MSILNAIKETKHSQDNILELAKLPQALIMQMAQRGDIPKDMVMPILGKKAEMVETAARMKAAQGLAAQGGAQPTVMDKYMGEIAQAENPAPVAPPMPQQMAQAPTAQNPEDVGIATQATQPMSMAGGGIVAFDDGGDVDIDPDDDYQELIDQAKRKAINNEIYDLIDQMAEDGGYREHAAVGIKSGANKHIKQDTREHATKHISDADQARKHNVGNLRPSGFSYPGQIGTSKGGFAMFESPEAGINALHHDIGIKLNRGLDTPTKFISVYAPASDNNDVRAYSNNVARTLGIGPNDRIPNTPEARQLLANAIIRQEGAHKATAAFANGGEVKHYVLGDLVMDDFGTPRGADPRSTPLYDEFGRTAAELEDEIQKNKKAGMPKDKAYKDAVKALEDQKLRRAAAGKAPAPSAASTPYERYIKPAFGRPSVAGVAVPTAVGIGGAYLSNAAANTLAGNKEMANAYFGDEYSDPGSDTALAYHILQNAKPEKKKDEFVDPNIERLKKMTTYGSNTPIRAPEQKDTSNQEAAPKEEFNLMDYIREQQAERRKAAEMDKWQAGLAAGLGMLGGTSQYAWENIGKGGQMGVQQLAGLQKLRASQDIASDKLLGTAYDAQLANKYRNLALAQNKNLSEARLNQDLIKARQAHVDKMLKEHYGMDMVLINQLRKQKKAGKLDTDKLKELEGLEQDIKNIQLEADKLYPSQTAIGTSKAPIVLR